MTRLQKFFPVLIVVLAVGAIVALALTDEGGPPDRRPASTTVTLGGIGGQTLPLDSQAQGQLQDLRAAAGGVTTTPVEPAEVHEDLATEPAAASDPGVVAANKRRRPPGQPTIPSALPQAAPSVEGCTTKLVRNFSSRNGAPVLLGVIHYTASPPTLGWAGVNANTAWFDSAAAQASSNEIMSRDGYCNLVVPEALKAWTQAGFNPVSVSVEIVTDGSPPTLMTARGDDALSRLLIGWNERWHIPLRRGAVSGCTVTRSGFVDHQQLGSCGGGHGDIGRYSVDETIAKAIAYARRSSTPLTTAEQRIARGLERPAGTGHSRRYWCSRAQSHRLELRRLGRTDSWRRRHRADRFQAVSRPFGRYCR